MKVPMELTNAIDRYGHGKIGVAYTTENGYIQSEFFEYENDLFEYLEKVFGDIELFAYGYMYLLMTILAIQSFILMMKQRILLVIVLRLSIKQSISQNR